MNPAYSDWRIVASGGQADGAMSAVGAGYLSFFHNGGGFNGHTMVLTDTGNVGIGVTNPFYTLHVVGAAAAPVYFGSPSNGNQLTVQSTPGGTYSAEYYTIGHNSSDGAFYIANGGGPGKGVYLSRGQTTGWASYSDRRLKENIIDISGSDMLTKIKSLIPVYYNFTPFLI